LSHVDSEATVFTQLIFSEIFREKNKIEELEKQLRDANLENCQWTERVAEYEEEIKSLKDNISLTGMAHGEDEEKLKEKLTELEEKCRGEIYILLFSYSYFN